ncbi:uncharacterized protein TNCT_65321 [Trichonephila clavata]|uniref:Uncharacterized protein n=1 Tax=Trichonephila clavata TaxID=2740835 RepID=A0A8X6IKI0_TRICU|nr:uncharacterized protein TNCT_65321 [Trichonephila clavata]
MLYKYVDKKRMTLRLVLFGVINTIMIALGFANDIYIARINSEALKIRFSMTSASDQKRFRIFMGLSVIAHCVWYFTIISSLSAFSLFYTMICMMFEKAFKKLDDETSYKTEYPMKLYTTLTKLLFVVDKKINYLFLLSYVFFEAMILRITYAVLFSDMAFYSYFLLFLTFQAFVLLSMMTSAAVKVHKAAQFLQERIITDPIEKCPWHSLPLVAKVVDEEVAMTLWSMVSVTKSFALTSFGMITYYVIIIGTLKAQ